MSQVPPTPKPRSALRFLPPVLAALVVAVLAYALLKPQGDTAEGGLLVDKPAPSFSLSMLDGGSLSLASLKGRPVVLNFWGSWCIPCRDEAPLLSKLAGQQRAGGLAVVGVLFQDKTDAAKAFVAQNGLAFPSLQDPGADTAINYGVTAAPETFFISPDGTVKAHVIGGLTPASIKVNLAKIGVQD